MGGKPVIFDAGKDYDILIFAEVPLGDVVSEKLAKTPIVEVKGGEEIEVEWLENESRVEGVARDLLVLNGVDSGIGESLEGDFLIQLLSFAKDGECNLVSGEFALDNFIHVDEFGPDTNVSCAVDFILIDGQEDVTTLKNPI